MEELNLALDNCLQQLAAGKASLAQCLARYPQYAAELRPLLETAMRFRQGRAMRPSGAVRDRTRSKLLSHMRTHPQPRTLHPIPRFAFGMAGIVLALGLVSSAAAQGALPGQLLYPLKLTTERAWRAASPDPLAVDISLADRRTAELLALAHEQTSAPKDQASESGAETEGIAAYNDVLNRLASESHGPDSNQILKVLEAHQQKLLHAGIHVPELDKIVGNDQNPNNPGQGQGQGQGGKP